MGARRLHIPKTYAAKYNDKINKKIGRSPSSNRTYSGKGGSTSKYGGNKSKISRG